MVFHFIDFVRRRSEYGSNRYRKPSETKMAFRLALIRAIDDVDAAAINTNYAARGAVLPSW